ncbi:MAG: hypothetical protein V4642_00165 [Bacteroidota bacterium]
MKLLQKNLLAGAAFALLGIIGCASPQGTREDYFGYNNKPVIEEEKPEATQPQAETAPQEKKWRNPLSDNSRTAHVYYEPVFVPVTAPWWDRYYGWEDYHHSRVVVMYPHHRVRYYDWDYANYPYYGGYPYYDRYPNYDRFPYNNYPDSREVEPVAAKKTSRGFGSSRGTINRDSEKDTRGSNNSGWKVRGRDGNVTTPTPEKPNESTSSSSSSRSRGSVGVTPRGGSSTEKKETTTTQTNTSKKSDSGAKKSEPAKSETKKETTNKVRGRGE